MGSGPRLWAIEVKFGQAVFRGFMIIAISLIDELAVRKDCANQMPAVGLQTGYQNLSQGPRGYLRSNRLC